MSIKTRLILLSFFFILVVGASCVLTVASLHSIRKEIDYSQKVGLVVRDVFELNIISYQYLLHNEERMKQQWLTKYKSSRKILAQLETISSPLFAPSVSKISSNYASFYRVFLKLEAHLEKRKSLLRITRKDDEAFVRSTKIERRLVTQLLIKAQQIIANAYELSDAMKNEIVSLQEDAESRLISSAGVFIFLALGGAFFAIKNITVPMRQLVDGAKLIGGGNLEHKLSIETRNEIGYLSKVFDQLIVDLKNLTIFRDELDQRVKDRTRELEVANTELSQYAYVVSHDLKAPLRAIRNYSDFLREDLEGKLDGDQETYLDGLGRAVGQGEELVNDLLTFSRIGKTVDTPESVDVGSFIIEVSEAINLPENVELKIDDGLPKIKTDRVLLTQVFRNLIDNAVKFNSSQVKCIRIGSCDTGEGYEIFVQDNGIGIEDRFFDKIFQVFQRLHTRSEYEGTGIGLSIVKKATEKMGGGIRLESELGKGSTFYIHIPFPKGEENR